MNNIILPVTQKQKRILRHIVKTIRKKGYPPTIYELRNDLKINNLGTVYSHLTGLEKKGYITKIKNKERGIRLTDISENFTLKQVDSIKEKNRG